LFERGIDICHETVRLWWNRFGPMFAGEIRRKRVQHRPADWMTPVLERVLRDCYMILDHLTGPDG
jgi:transposase-like protein